MLPAPRGKPSALPSGGRGFTVRSAIVFRFRAEGVRSEEALRR
jgi:hypothetical protein